MINLPLKREIFENFQFSFDRSIKSYDDLNAENIKLERVMYDYESTIFLSHSLKHSEEIKAKLSRENLFAARYLCEISGVMDIKNYTVIGKGHETEVIMDKNINDKFNQGINEIQNIQGEIEKYKFIHSLFSPDTEFKMATRKEFVDSSFADIDKHDYSDGYFDDDNNLTHISYVEIKINSERLSINDFLKSNNMYISTEDDKILNPVFKKLDLDNPDNYSAEIVDGYYGDELAGFSIDENKMNQLEMIANRVILNNDLDQKKKLVDDFINDRLEDENKIEVKPESKITKTSSKKRKLR